MSSSSKDSGTKTVRRREYASATDFRGTAGHGLVSSGETNCRIPSKIHDQEGDRRRVSVGKISLNQHGVNNGKEWLPWSQLREIQITRGYLSLKKEGDKHGNWRVIQAADIPNVDVFMALVNGIQSGKRS